MDYLENRYRELSFMLAFDDLNNSEYETIYTLRCEIIKAMYGIYNVTMEVDQIIKQVNAEIYFKENQNNAWHCTHYMVQ